MRELFERYPLLAEYVDDVWVEESQQPDPAIHSFKFFADGRPGLMYIQSAEDAFLNIDERKLANLFIYGQTVKPIEISIRGKFRFIVFRFFPHVMKPLFHLDANELTDNCLDICFTFAPGAEFLEEKLSETGNRELQLELMAQFLLEVIARTRDDVHTELGAAAQKLLKSYGDEHLVSLQQMLHMTERTFQRKFQQHVGLSPKQFARIVKFDSAFEQLKSNNYHSLTDLAYEYGYSDQSHFNRTFKEFTGMTPLQFLESR